MKEAIQKAVEGGFEPTIAERECCDDINFYHTQYKLLCDPLFWQCLGKAMGWESYWYGFWDTVVEDERGWRWHPKSIMDRTHLQTSNLVTIKEGWEHHWHRFIDSLASGQSPDDFFKKLLNQK